MISALWSRFAGYITALGALLTIIVGAFLKGRSDASRAAKLQDIQNANDIRKAGADARADAASGRLRDSDGWRRN